MTTYALDPEQFQVVVIYGGLLVLLLSAILATLWGK